MYYVPRGGNRGGADQFKWEDVKEDKGRECYLGHSLMAPVGRWQKNKDLQWFSKDKQNEGTGSVSTEIQKARDAEREAMLIALGQKVGDRLAAETMKPQTDDSLLKLQRSKPAKHKKKLKEKEKKKGKRKNKEILKKYKNKKSKRKRRDSSDSDGTESSSESESDSDSSSDDEREQPAKKRKHSRGKEHRGGRERDSYHHRDRSDKNSSRTDRDRRKRGGSRERERKKYYDKR